MAKTKSNRKNGNKRGNWSNTDHEYRTAKRIASLNKKRRRQQQQLEQSEANDDQQQSFDNQPTKKKKQPHHELPIHQIRLKKKAHRNKHNRLTSAVDPDAYKRSHLAHDNYDQIDSTKLRLATSQIQRKVNNLKLRLESWDPVAEAKLAKLQSNEQYEDKNSIEYKMKLHTHNTTLDKVARAKAHDEYNLLYAKHGVNSSTHRRKANLRSKPRPGPESWKLRGAARPAHEVYDFDVRYVDKHILAHNEANEIARRSINILVVCKGRFAVDNGDESVDEEGDGNNTNQQEKKKEEKKQFQPPQPYCRDYLSLLTQLASLHLHRNNYSSARTALLECINLEGPHHSTSITNARYQLMNMYLHTNRPSSARKLSNLLINDNSAWIKYSMALIEYISWNLLNEEGSTSSTAEDMLKLAIRGNVYVVYLLAFSTTFEKSMEYTNEVCIEHELESSSCSLLEAIEYGCNCYNEGENDDEGKGMDKGMAIWMSTEGSLDWVRSVVLRVLNEDESTTGSGQEDRLTKADLLSWESKLNKEEEVYEKERNEKEQEKLALNVSKEDGKIDYGKEDDEDDDDLDVVMYAGMFRTAMDWLSDAGELLKAPNYDYIVEQPNDIEEEDNANDGDVVEEEEKVTAEGSNGSTSEVSGTDSDEESKNE